MLSIAFGCFFLLRKTLVSIKGAASQPEFDFVELLNCGPDFEYAVLVTNDASSIVTLAQLYRDRADCENVFDEIKNHWGWGGFVTQDLPRCRIIARLTALVYNWWNIFARLANPKKHMEAITSRPLLLHSVGRLVSTGRRNILRLTSTHAMSVQIQGALNQISSFLNKLSATAEQLSQEKKWATILSLAFIKWLRGRVLCPLWDGDQRLLRLDFIKSNCSF